MFEKFIIGQNSHWKGNLVKSGYPRLAMEEITKYIDTRQVIAIAGVRRCGKSTTVKQLINFLISDKNVNPKNILFLNLESTLLNEFKSNPDNLRKIYEEYLVLVKPKGKIYIFLDEAQFFADWQVFVKELYEKGGVKFFITGSNSQLLSAEMATLLSGRSIIKKIYPFDFQEMAQIKEIDFGKKVEIIENELKFKRLFSGYLKYGGFPEIFLEKEKEIRNEILANYYKNILYNDIIPRFGVKNTKEIESLLLYLFSNIGQRYSYNSLSKSFSVIDKTIKEYIGFFEKSFLLFEISNYQYSLKKQENYPKKVYAIDNGFIKISSFSFSENYGRFLENTVFLNLQKKEGKVYYYQGNNECDFIIERGKKVVEAIQVSKELNSRNEKREISGLLEAMKEFNLKEGLVITENQEEEKMIDGKKIKIIPVWKWLLSL